eukprot:CAMPEP_0202004858 /NCGR_PEP_ID=MMETSP0905-20130828/10068_1 /ASSEMBLY_ACC=CAM_ASM_000554 /TAXON_ID=420261 /ORGANISM="Thalassiosira antarctica, Strain CCMP982" /LENGTH=274 /DNA_ID=CAMNT_0048562303 /DNA_START=74 /DNA_END=898 /DNA_ORIENTATION=+
MKLLSVIVVGVANAAQALPPGYEDQIWCPPDNCEIYTNPYGYVGADSSFFKCYNPATDETTDGVWTGSLSDTSAPEGYVEPEMCTGSEYSECDTADDCSLAISPSCECFVSSSFHPYNPCEGLGASKCTDRCTGEECDEHEATCSPGSNGRGGTCEIGWNYGDGSFEDTEKPTPAPAATGKISAECVSTDQCYAKIRSEAPWPAIGVGLCECYAASRLDPFDECEGRDNHCRMARCRSGSCDGVEAYCDIAPDDNGMGECTLRSTSDTELLEVV